jgi:membrane-associated phospholipid phosphatase
MPAIVAPIARETRRRERLLAFSLPISVVAFVIFYKLAQRDWASPPMPWDQRLTRWVQGVHLPGLRRMMLLVSWPGWPPQNWALTTLAAIVLFRAGFRAAPWIVLAALPVEAAVTGLKYGVNRERPIRPTPGPRFWPSDPSFPSGHTVQYTLVLGFLAHLTRLYVHRQLARRLALSILGLLIALIGPSRIYLGHHWPTDVVAGYSLGMGLLFSFVQLYELLRLKTRMRPAMQTATDAVSPRVPPGQDSLWLNLLTRS